MDWYVVNVNPEPWAIGDVGMGRRNGKLFPYVGPNKQLKEYKAAIRDELESMEHRIYQGPVRIKFYFWRQSARYDNLTGGTNTRNRPDVTNMQKATEDALQGVLFANDREVVHIESMLVQADPDIEGRVLIGIELDNRIPNAFIEIPPEAMAELSRGIAEYSAQVTKTNLEWGDEDDLPF